jgi:hypothetical protein
MEQAVNAVAVIRVVLCGVDSALGGNTMGAPGAVLVTESVDPVTEFCQGCSRGGPRKAGADYDNRKFPFVGRVYQFHFPAMFVPLFFQLSCWNFSVKYHAKPLYIQYAYKNGNRNGCKAEKQYKCDYSAAFLDNRQALLIIQSQGLKKALDTVVQV